MNFKKHLSSIFIIVLIALTVNITPVHTIFENSTEITTESNPPSSTPPEIVLFHDGEPDN